MQKMLTVANSKVARGTCALVLRWVWGSVWLEGGTAVESTAAPPPLVHCGSSTQ